MESLRGRRRRLSVGWEVACDELKEGEISLTVVFGSDAWQNLE